MPRLSILVVEGQHTAGQAITGLLRRRGHEVRLVTSAEDALGCGHADVLVSDLDLPGASGLELLQELRRRGSAARTIFVGARPSLEESRRALELGAIELLAKPFRLAELVRAVESGTGPSRPAVANAQTHDGSFDRTYPSQPGSVEQAARELVAYALRSGIAPAARARIGSATSELVDNAFRHGYGRGRGPIRVEGRLAGGEFSVRVGDEGIGFDALVLEASQLDDTLRHGLARARALSEELQIESRPGGGTRVLLVFRASRVAFDEEGGIDLSELDFIGPDLARRMLQALREGRDADPFQLSPALAVVVGRLLAGPDPRTSIETALWS